MMSMPRSPFLLLLLLSSLAIAEEVKESCLRAGEFFFDPRTGVEDIVQLALASVRSLKSGGAAVVSADAATAPSDPGTKEEDATEIPQTGDSALDVHVSFYVDDINSISSRDMEYRMDYYMTQKWKTDDKFCQSYSRVLSQRNITLGERRKEVTITNTGMNLFWVPDTFTMNAKSTFMQSQVMSTKSLTISMTKDLTGSQVCDMTFIVRYAGIIPCEMVFTNYPVDTQGCEVQLRSFAYGAEKVILVWQDLDQRPSLSLMEHELAFKHRAAFQTERQQFNKNFSVLVIEFSMKRKIANKLASVYTPSLVIVLITFTTFWLGPASIADRITIGITAFLAIVTQFSQSRDELPPVSYMSGMDVWNLVCMVFVSSQILQATLVHFLNERRAVRDDSSRDGSKDRAADEKDGAVSERLDSSPVPRMGWDANMFAQEELNYGRDYDFQLRDCCEPCVTMFDVEAEHTSTQYLPLRVDAFSRVLVPLMFALFCAIYWPILFHNS